MTVGLDDRQAFLNGGFESGEVDVEAEVDQLLEFRRQQRSVTGVRTV